MKKRFSMFIAGVLMALSTTVAASPANAAVPCWTSFNPGSPQGNPMRQYYKNCGSSTVSVAPYYSSASIVFYGNSCKTVAPGNYVSWYFDGTWEGVNYSTATCANTYLNNWYTQYKTAGSVYSCNTSFKWWGAELEQRYGNCDLLLRPQTVTTAWRTTNGNLYASPSGIQVVAGDDTAIWNFRSTVQANYTTVLVDMIELPA
ncbi:hypothetical protein RMN56_31455 [Micromonospora halotolerans]|uniref:Secreted protein n=1 Tax=Micromonospora halotolerans TaxID=709879 RepID=A0ABY9ZW89_9ACTN|nr:hypothetical protein [Micromonospora halotolerans]WNM39568.1 hypothetical protein RMN56_31455 [Micromonospora halotolerans]